MKDEPVLVIDEEAVDALLKKSFLIFVVTLIAYIIT